MRARIPTILLLLALAGAFALFTHEAGGAKGLTVRQEGPAPDTDAFTLIQQGRAIEFFTEHVNSSFRLPVDMTLTLATCGEGNAFYEPESHNLLLCREAVQEFYDLSRKADPEHFEDLYLDTVLFTLFHEFGHAAIDIFDMPGLGREEDVADQIGSWLMLTGVGSTEPDGINAVLNAASFFVLESDAYRGTDSQSTAWDAHPLDLQRYYNIICWSYGYSPTTTSEILGETLDKALPQERREGCEDEYARLSGSLARLLAPHLKNF